MAQLVERSLPTPEICGSNPDISKILSTNCTIEMTKIKKKRPGMAHLKKRSSLGQNNNAQVLNLGPIHTGSAAVSESIV